MVYNTHMSATTQCRCGTTANANGVCTCTRPKTKSGRPPLKYGRRYPWNRWFMRGRFCLRRGIDYEHHTHTMAQMIRNVASKRGLRVSIRIAPDGQSLTASMV